MLSGGRLLILLPVLALCLQGCVAAVIPLAAAGAMVRSVEDDPSTPGVESRLSVPASQQEQPEGLNASQLPQGESVDPLEAGQRQELILLEGLTELPTPSGRTAPPSGSPVFGEFAEYALELANRDMLADEVRPSALLANPGILTPDRAPCRFTGNAVLVDLDPVDGVFDLDTATAPEELAQALNRLRAADVEVVWSTALTADRAGDIRTWLRRSALDPEGEDRLLLLRYPDDRKQTRREEAAKETCLIAMIGDERSDFDELFDYLKDPGFAIGLDAMIGQGWFLAPIPLEGKTP